MQQHHKIEKVDDSAWQANRIFFSVATDDGEHALVLSWLDEQLVDEAASISQLRLTFHDRVTYRAENAAIHRTCAFVGGPCLRTLMPEQDAHDLFVLFIREASTIEVVHERMEEMLRAGNT